MKCEICSAEYDGIFCPVCGWEKENILDDKYLKIYEEKKEVYKKNVLKVKQTQEKYENTMESFTSLLNGYLAKGSEFAKDVCETMLKSVPEDDKYYFTFLVAKIYLDFKEGKIERKLIDEALKIRKSSDVLNPEDVEFFDNLIKRIK